jgi:DNA-binding CsgD family transcriptional regulator
MGFPLRRLAMPQSRPSTLTVFGSNYPSAVATPDQNLRSQLAAAPALTAVPVPQHSVQSILEADFGLTPREVEIAVLLTDGLSYREIAEQLNISFHTVNSHVNAIRSKTGLSSVRRLPALLRQAR